ncbi:mannose-binding protein [Gavia stellata]|uniref:mannose-binding protein n=1 Tax=Gavia stellata TaxID=37040 RepID=UPI00289B787E|nr:mannose-binding protein [Gavia stellata]
MAVFCFIALPGQQDFKAAQVCGLDGHHQLCIQRAARPPREGQLPSLQPLSWSESPVAVTNAAGEEYSKLMAPKASNPQGSSKEIRQTRHFCGLQGYKMSPGCHVLRADRYHMWFSAKIAKARPHGKNPAGFCSISSLLHSVVLAVREASGAIRVSLCTDQVKVLPFNALELWLSLLMVVSSVNTDKPEEKIYSCPVIQCSAPAVNGLPGKDGRGEKGEPGGLRGLQGFPGKVGPLEIKGDLGPKGEKGEKYIFKKIFVLMSGILITSFEERCDFQKFVVTDDLQRQVTALETKVQVLEAEVNRYKKALILKNIKSIGGKNICLNWKEDIFDNGKSLCAKAGSALASPRNEAENTALKDLTRPSKQAYMRIFDEQTEGRFMYLKGGAVTYRSWTAGEPNNLKNEDCAVIQDSGKWNDSNCSNSCALFVKS